MNLKRGTVLRSGVVWVALLGDVEAKVFEQKPRQYRSGRNDPSSWVRSVERVDTVPEFLLGDESCTPEGETLCPSEQRETQSSVGS